MMWRHGVYVCLRQAGFSRMRALIEALGPVRSVVVGLSIIPIGMFLVSIVLELV